MKKYLIYLFLFLLSSTIYFVDLSVLPYMRQVNELFRKTIYPLLEVKGKVWEKAKELANSYIFLRNISIENQRLKRELQECELYKLKSITYEKRLLELTKAMDLPFEVENYNLTYANVIAYDPSGNDQFIILDKGIGSGISEGMIVFYRDMLLGIVEEVYGSSSKVRTVFSKDFSISATSADKAYIYKGGFPYGNLMYVKIEDEIKEGDLVLFRPSGKKLPWFVIGKVKEVSHEGESFFKRVKVEPAIDVRRTSLYVILKEKL